MKRAYANNENYNSRKERKMTHAQKSKELFLQGANCSQALTAAFADVVDLDESTLLRLSSSFGGGMGRLREVCGACSGMFLIVGLLYGEYDISSSAQKGKHYEKIQTLAKRFKEENGNIICRELLGLDHESDIPVPEERTAAYYEKRPCLNIIESAANILDLYLEEQKKEA